MLFVSDRCTNQGLVGDLEEAITLGRAVLKLHLPGHPCCGTSVGYSHGPISRIQRPSCDYCIHGTLFAVQNGVSNTKTNRSFSTSRRSSTSTCFGVSNFGEYSSDTNVQCDFGSTVALISSSVLTGQRPRSSRHLQHGTQLTGPRLAPPDHDDIQQAVLTAATKQGY